MSSLADQVKAALSDYRLMIRDPLPGVEQELIEADSGLVERISQLETEVRHAKDDLNKCDVKRLRNYQMYKQCLSKVALFREMVHGEARRAAEMSVKNGRLTRQVDQLKMQGTKGCRTCLGYCPKCDADTTNKT